MRFHYFRIFAEQTSKQWNISILSFKFEIEVRKIGFYCRFCFREDECREIRQFYSAENMVFRMSDLGLVECSLRVFTAVGAFIAVWRSFIHDTMNYIVFANNSLLTIMRAAWSYFLTMQGFSWTES